MILRDDLYFEPRVISETGRIRWYSESYSAEQLLLHTEETVYIRDNGKDLFIYSLENDQLQGERKIKAVFTLICRIKKRATGYRYGRKII